GGRTARATTNKLDDASLKQVVAAAESISRVQHPDPELLPMPAPSDVLRRTETPSRYFPETAAITPAERAESVRQMVAVAERHKLTTAGVYSTSQWGESIFNSRGFADHHIQTSSEVSITMLGEDASGWQKANSPDVRALDPVALAEV